MKTKINLLLITGCGKEGPSLEIHFAATMFTKLHSYLVICVSSAAAGILAPLPMNENTERQRLEPHALNST